jgi:hypothetical protein
MYKQKHYAKHNRRSKSSVSTVSKVASAPAEALVLASLHGTPKDKSAVSNAVVKAVAQMSPAKQLDAVKSIQAKANSTGKSKAKSAAREVSKRITRAMTRGH